MTNVVTQKIIAEDGCWQETQYKKDNVQFDKLNYKQNNNELSDIRQSKY